MAKDRTKFNFDMVIRRLGGGSANAMREMAMENKNYFLSSFKKGSFDGHQWKEVNRRIDGTKEYKYPATKKLARRTRPILVGRGALRRAVNQSIKFINGKQIRFEVKLPYAEIHNQGGKAGRGGSANIPKRQYMGESRQMNLRNRLIIKKYVNKSFSA